MAEVKSFRDLLVWQRAMQVCVAVYELTREFPREELYGLTSQVRRASVSVISNIAEGHGRDSLSQLIHFLTIARGSIFEVQAQLLLAHELHYGAEERISRCQSLCDEVSRMLYATLRSLRIKLADKNSVSDL